MMAILIHNHIHWHRLVKILGGPTKILGGQKVGKRDKCMGVSQLLGGMCPGCPPKVYEMLSDVIVKIS